MEFYNANSIEFVRERKIIIFSNCPASNRKEICDGFEFWVRHGTQNRFAATGDVGTDFSIKIWMVNQAVNGNVSEMDDYLMCLVEDEGRIYVNDNIDKSKWYDQILPSIKHDICGSPMGNATVES